jgi:regulatory protein
MQVKKEMTAQEAFSKLAALCARSEHCQKEMTDKMRLWGVSEEEQAQVMERLVKERYINDERYARAFANDKTRYCRWGRRKVEQALWQKHIDENIIRQVLDSIDDDLYADTLRPLLQQKRRTVKAASDYELNMKLIKFALSRGFSMEVIRKCLEVADEDEFLE